jgi:capsular exopolysaccharide synthesis family protein
VEQYRRIAAALHHANAQRGVRSVMVGSAVAAEGKTLSATNIALTLSHSFDRRVLLIDADLRRPSLHDMFGLPNDHGLVDSLRVPTGGRLPVHAAARNLWILTAGRGTSDPMSGLVSETMKQLLNDAAEQFDWVIVDTPPVALMPDANLLASLIDGALLVVSAHTTPYPLVQRAAAAIGPDRILGVILNRTDHSGLAQEYGYYYGYTDRAPQKPATGMKRFRLFSRRRSHRS